MAQRVRHGRNFRSGHGVIPRNAVAPTGDSFLQTFGSGVITADSVPLSFSNDIDIRFLCRVLNFDFSGGIQSLVAKWGAAGQRSWYFQVNTTGALRFQWTTDGTTQISALCSATIGAIPGIGDRAVWIRVTLDIDNGATGNDCKFFYSYDGVNWTQLGTTITQAGVTSFFDSNNGVSIGGSGAGGAGTTFDNGRIYEAIVMNGIGGTTVADFNVRQRRDHASNVAVLDAFGNSWVGVSTTLYRYGQAERLNLWDNGAQS